MNGNFGWVKISEKIANKILEYKEKDNELMEIIQNIKTDDLINLQFEQIKNGDKFDKIEKIDGFTAMNIIFMRAKKPEKESKFIEKFEEKTGMEKDVFNGKAEGIPYLKSNLILFGFSCTSSPTVKVRSILTTKSVGFKVISPWPLSVLPSTFKKLPEPLVVSSPT